MKKQGILRSWNQYGYSFIQEVGPVMKRYFLQVSGIGDGPAKSIPGMHVVFDVSDKPPYEAGGLPHAVDVEFVETAGAVTALPQGPLTNGGGAK